MNASEDELVALHGAADRWEKRSVWVLLAGLAAEVCFIWVPEPTFWTRIGDTVATVMVVLGVWAEVAFGNVGAAAQGEQLRRSNVQLDIASKLANRAEHEATAARRELAQATERLADERRERLKLEWHIARRSLSADQQRDISDALKQFAGKTVAIYSYAGDLEGGLLAQEIIAVLLSASIKVASRIASVLALESLKQGIAIDGSDVDLKQALHTTLAFRGNLIVYPDEVHGDSGTTSGDARILVGFKVLAGTGTVPGGPR